jgi:7-cyano-7-deazaguanine reductase
MTMTTNPNSGKIEDAPLGKISSSPMQFNPELLFPIPRSTNRALLNCGATLPFIGVDIWNAYELSWLGPRNKPEVAIAQFDIPFDSPFLIESKSFKLYLNSLNYANFRDTQAIQSQLKTDLSQACGTSIQVQLFSPQEWKNLRLGEPEGRLLDRLDIAIFPEEPPDSMWLTADFDSAPIEQILYSNLLRSNCPVTGQPDWASIFIEYMGPAITEASLLRYLIAFRNHQEFHEHCVEKIFCDIKNQCKPLKLSVYARYTRRGGLDINPYRTDTTSAWPKNTRLARQ